MEISKRLKQISQAQTIIMTEKAREMNNRGLEVINLSIGEPDFDTPQYIQKAAKDALKDGYTKYTPIPGFMDLRVAISEKFKRNNDLNYTPDQIVVSNGAKHSIMNVIMSYINPDDEVIIPAPFWVSYPEMVKLAGGIPKIIGSSHETDYKSSINEIKKVINGRTKLFIFSSPCNPSGSVWSQEELESIAHELAKYPEILIISDEIYEHIHYGKKHFSIGSIPSVKDQVITINGMSKAFSMTGWRIGYMGAPQWMADACIKLQGQFTSGANSIAQKASIIALNSELTETIKMKDEFNERRKFVINALKEIKGFIPNEPEGAFYVFPNIEAFFGTSYKNHSINNAQDFALYLLEVAHVSIVGGGSFGTQECVRISYSASLDTLTKAMSRIKKACNKLLK